MRLFRNKYFEIRSGWALSFGLLLANVLALPSTLIFLLVISPHYESLVPKPANYAIIEAGFYILQQGLIVVGSILAFYICTKRSAHEMGYNALNFKSGMIKGFLTGSATVFSILFLLVIAAQVSVMSIRMSALLSTAFWIDTVLCVAVSVGEETLARGFMMSVLKVTRKPVAMIMIPAILFAALHFANPGFGLIGFLNLFLLGILFSLLFLRSGSLWSPIAAHFAWNWVQGSILGLNVSGINKANSLIELSFTGTETLLTGGEFGIEGSPLLSVALIVAVVLSVLIIKTPKVTGWTLNSGLPFSRYGIGEEITQKKDTGYVISDKLNIR